jgi:hypothetical protein
MGQNLSHRGFTARRSTPSNRQSAGSRVAVVANGFDRTALQRFHASRNILFRSRLLTHKRVTTLFGSGEESWRRLAAQIAVDALLVDVKFAGGVDFPLVCFIGHG